MVITAQNINNKPGYKQTEVGMIPEDWEVYPLGDIVTKVGSGITPTGGEKVYKKEGRPFMRSQNVGWGHLLFDDIAFIDDETHQSFPNTELKLDDVLLNITGASIGRSAIVDERLVGGNVNQHVCIIRTNVSRLNPFYLNFFLLSASGQKQIESFQAGGNRQGLNFGQIKSFQVPLPPLPEQHAIATALNDVDAFITSLDKLIAKKRDIKQATMQQLLTGKTRLPGFSRQPKPIYKQTDAGMIPEDWVVKELGQLGELKNGINKGKMDFGHGFPFVNLLDVFGVIKVSNDSEFGLVNSTETERKVYSLKKGDVLFVRSSVKPEGVGLTTLIAENLRDTVYSGFLIRFRDKGELTFGFKEHCFGQFGFRNRLIANSTFSANTNINQNALKMLLIALPPLPEQTAIANVLSDMDAEIAALERKRDKVRAMKQGMMQELLTGKTRLL